MTNVYNKLNTHEWGVRLMALLIVFYQIIQQLQMEKTCFYV